MLLLPLTGAGAPFVLFFAAILASSFYGGKGPGFVATVLGASIGTYYFNLGGSYQAVSQALIFAAEGVGVTFLAEALLQSKRKADDAIRGAHRAVRMRDDLVAVVSHDLKNPLTSIDLKVSVLMRKTQGETVEHLQSVRRSVHRMRRLVDDLLDIAKIESGQLSVDRVRHDANDVMHEAVEMLEPIAAEKSLHLEKSTCEPNCVVECDRERISQVLINLIGNAIKFTAEGGKIRVGSERLAHAIRYFVKDTGPGIPKESLPHIFDRYWQAQKTTRHGLGLGLAIAKGIVEAHGGKIWAVSRLGEGSTFYFTLPTLAPAQAESERRQLQLVRR